MATSIGNVNGIKIVTEDQYEKLMTGEDNTYSSQSIYLISDLQDKEL